MVLLAVTYITSSATIGIVPDVLKLPKNGSFIFQDTPNNTFVFLYADTSKTLEIHPSFVDGL